MLWVTGLCGPRLLIREEEGDAFLRVVHGLLRSIKNFPQTSAAPNMNLDFNKSSRPLSIFVMMRRMATQNRRARGLSTWGLSFSVYQAPPHVLARGSPSKVLAASSPGLRRYLLTHIQSLAVLLFKKRTTPRCILTEFLHAFSRSRRILNLRMRQYDLPESAATFTVIPSLGAFHPSIHTWPAASQCSLASPGSTDLLCSHPTCLPYPPSLVTGLAACSQRIRGLSEPTSGCPNVGVTAQVRPFLKNMPSQHADLCQRTPTQCSTLTMAHP